MIELLFLRAICHHALGYVREAVRDYEDCLTFSSSNSTDEQRAFQFLSFYQKEMALYMYKNLDRPVLNFCPDAELQPLFKVGQGGCQGGVGGGGCQGGEGICLYLAPLQPLFKVSRSWSVVTRAGQ